MGNIPWGKIKNFQAYEFEDPLVGGSGELIDPVLLYRLSALREQTGWMMITHFKVGGCVDVHGQHGHSERSYHLAANGCKAVDFHFHFGEKRFSLREQYYEVAKMGFGGLGVYPYWNSPGFHVDRRPPDKTQRWYRDPEGTYFYIIP